MFTSPLRQVLAAFLLSSLLVPIGAIAQDWPNKPIRLVINFAPGSSPDVLGRAVATPLSQALGVPVVVENRSGAGGIVGAEVVTKAGRWLYAADGLWQHDGRGSHSQSQNALRPSQSTCTGSRNCAP